jgi:hypothetical protein
MLILLSACGAKGDLYQRPTDAKPSATLPYQEKILAAPIEKQPTTQRKSNHNNVS